MGTLYLNTGEILSFKAHLKTENVRDYIFNVINLEVVSSTARVKYRISSDERHPDINIIQQDLDEGLHEAQSTNASFEISEYLIRNYILITYPNGKTKQYTAKRLQIKHLP